MFTNFDVAGSSVLLCGEAERTARVALKYGQAAVLKQVDTVDGLESVLASQQFALVVACVATEDEALPWFSAVRSAGSFALTIWDDEAPVSEVGTVFLIGAGPGDPGLMTRHALEALAKSDVILLDHLAPHQDLASWAPHAEVIDVGKIPGKHRVPQREIDALMVRFAKEGKNVARLKGGDPYVFGRGAEELYVCEQNGIPAEVFSGVTSSIALPALAGVPITLRGVSHMFTVVSGHKPLADSELDQIAGLLKDGGTVSLLMGVKTLSSTVAGLKARGVPDELPMMTVENGFRPNQREVPSTLGDCLETLSDVKPPAVTTLGWVCAAAGEKRDEIMGKAFETH